MHLSKGWEKSFLFDLLFQRMSVVAIFHQLTDFCTDQNRGFAFLAALADTS